MCGCVITEGTSRKYILQTHSKYPIKNVGLENVQSKNVLHNNYVTICYAICECTYVVVHIMYINIGRLSLMLKCFVIMLSVYKPSTLH